MHTGSERVRRPKARRAESAEEAYIYMINFMSRDNVFEDPGDARGISGPLLQNEKVTVCCYSSFLCLVVSLTRGKSVLFINFMLLFLLLKHEYVAPETLI